MTEKADAYKLTVSDLAGWCAYFVPTRNGALPVSS
jgi:hypothetical protein